MRAPKVLVACEESQAVTIAMREIGIEAYSCDIIECSGGHPEWHIIGDVLPLLNGAGKITRDFASLFETQDGTHHELPEKWDMILAFPPCTYLCNTGTPYLDVGKWGQKAVERAKKREAAFDFFMAMANAECEKIVIENPVGMPNSRYRKPDQIINPWQFGHPFTKKTCLWLKGVRKLMPEITEKPDNIKSYAFHTMYDENGKTISWNSEISKKLRSKTFEGIARAMADQWGRQLIKELNGGGA
jgi:hypothetical protein